MAHPNGGENPFSVQHTFSQAFNFVGPGGFTFFSTTGEQIHARQGWASDKKTRTIVFHGERNVHGRVCHACWGFRVDCNQSRVGQCAEALDELIS